MLNLIELFRSFETIATINNDNRFSAIPIPGYDQHRLGKDAQGRPLLLISILDVQSPKRPAPIVLEHLTVMYDIDCRIFHPDSTTEEGKFTVVRCTGVDTTLHTYFLQVTSAIVASLKNRPTPFDVARIINQLIELFRAIINPSRKSAQGLWAELFLITQARQPAVLINAWHTQLEDRYDFAMDDQRIEVKSVLGRNRQHYFSLEQLYPPEGVKALVASVFVERSQAGVSIADLTEEIRNRLWNNPDLLLQMDKIIALALGDSWHQASEIRFDRRLAKESLAFFDVSEIPSVNPDLPVGVSSVHFQSDLTEIPMAPILHYGAEGGLFKAAFR